MICNGLWTSRGAEIAITSRFATSPLNPTDQSVVLYGLETYVAGLEKWIQSWRGLGLGGPEEKGPQVSQRAQNHLPNYRNCWKTVKEK